MTVHPRSIRPGSVPPGSLHPGSVHPGSLHPGSGHPARRYQQPAEVGRADGAPEWFRWRGRLYLVREVLAEWVQTGEWWRTASAQALADGTDVSATGIAGTGDDLVLGVLPPSPKWGQRAWGEPAPDVGVSLGPVRLDDGEQECWRVLALRSGSVAEGVYDLSFEVGSGCWTVDAVAD